MPQLHVLPYPPQPQSTGVGQILLQAFLERYMTLPYKQKMATEQWGKEAVVDLLKSGKYEIAPEEAEGAISIGGKRLRRVTENKALTGFVNEGGDYVVPVINKEGKKVRELNYGKKYQQLNNPWAWFLQEDRTIDEVTNFAKRMKEVEKMPKFIPVTKDGKEYWQVFTVNQANQAASRGTLILKPKGMTMADIYTMMFGFGPESPGSEGGAKPSLNELIPLE